MAMVKQNDAGAVGREPMSSRARLRAILGGSAGNLVEWFDWYTYSATAIYFASVFFPKGDQTAQLLQAAGVFAVGFAARPVGAWIMGVYADKAGRRAALTLSVAMMCLGSLVIAVTPGAASIGAAAPVILLLARIFQGLSLGGEYGASATYMSEMAGRGSRGFWSSFQAATMIGGQLVALAVLIVLQNTLSKADMVAWGWRIPFVIGAALAVFVFWLRRRLDETGAFVEAKAAGAERGRTSLLWLKHPRETLIIMGLTAAGSLTFYIYTTYMQKFLINTAGFSKITATEISAASLVGFFLAQPLFGWLSDRFGRRAMLILAYGGGALTVFPIMTALAGMASPYAAFVLILAGMILLAAYTSVGAIVKAELFPAHIRAVGVALPYAIANALFGGTAEYVALWFKSAGSENGFYVYAAGTSAVGLLIALTMRETRTYSRIDNDAGETSTAAPRQHLKVGPVSGE
jgi:MFS transporter, MHS family, alpha-ketoglutarate permease